MLIEALRLRDTGHFITAITGPSLSAFSCASSFNSNPTGQHQKNQEVPAHGGLQYRKGTLIRKSQSFIRVCKQTHPMIFLWDGRYCLSSPSFEKNKKLSVPPLERWARREAIRPLFSTITFCHVKKNHDTSRNLSLPRKKPCPIGDS